MSALFFIKEIFSKFPKLMSINIILILLMSGTDVLSILSLSPVVDLLLNENSGKYSDISNKILSILQLFGLPIDLKSVISVFLIFNILRSVFAIWVKYSLLKTKYEFEKNILIHSFDTFFNARWQFFCGNKQGKLLNSFTRELAIVGSSYLAIAHLAANIIQIIFYIIVPCYISFKVTLISFISAILFIIPFFILGKYSKKLGEKSTNTSNRITEILIESFSAAKLILGFGNKDKSIKSLSKVYDNHVSAVIKAEILTHSITVIYFPLGITVLTIAVLTGKSLLLPISEITVILYSFMKILPSIGKVTQFKNAIENFFPSYEQINKLKQQAIDFKQPTGKIPFKKIKNIIEIKNLTFEFNKNIPILYNISMKIKKGQMVAIVGESGAGKTTLIDIIMGFNSPNKGKIEIDDIPFKLYDINSYRNKIGYVSQDSFLFNMTIKDNLRWACETADEEKIIEACKKVNAHSFIMTFPQKYNTIVGDRGVRLSGGQIQRIALARAMIRDPEIIILDEATSALDTETELFIQKTIENIAHKTTVIAIAHRISTIANYDYIYLMNNGRILEEGTYLKLIKAERKFHKMVQLQNLT